MESFAGSLYAPPLPHASLIYWKLGSTAIAYLEIYNFSVKKICKIILNSKFIIAKELNVEVANEPNVNGDQDGDTGPCDDNNECSAVLVLVLLVALLLASFAPAVLAVIEPKQKCYSNFGKF